MLAKSSLHSGKINIMCRPMKRGRTNNLVQLLTVVQYKGVDLSIGRLLRNTLVLGKMSKRIRRDAQNYVTCCASDSC